MQRLAVIGSHGVDPGQILTRLQSVEVSTTEGQVSAWIGEANGQEVAYLTRSGGKPGIAPHVVNYRANILALKQLDVSCIFSTAMVGALTSGISEGSFVILDQFIDFTRYRHPTLYDREGFVPVDMTDPYCPRGRAALLRAALARDLTVLPTGCYVGLDGPRYETRAEVEMYRSLGGDVVGHSNVPEVVMAREGGMCYATLALVTNLGAGYLGRPLLRRDVHRATLDGVETILAVLQGALSQVTADDSCSCQSAADDFISR